MRAVVTICAKVIGCDISWSKCGGLTTIEAAILTTSERRRARLEIWMRIWHGIETYVTYWVVEVEVSCLQVSRPKRALVEKIRIQDWEELASSRIRNIGNELEGVREWGNYKRVVAVRRLATSQRHLCVGDSLCEGPFYKIEADTTCIDNDQTRYIRARLVDDRCCQRYWNQRKDISWRAEWLTRETVSLRSTSIKGGEIEILAILCDLGSHSLACGSIKGFVLRATSMVRECQAIPIQVAS